MKVEQNTSRLQYLLALYQMSEDDLLMCINEGHTRLLTKDDIFGTEIEVSYLKRIDKEFNKGLHYYLDPQDLQISQDASIFFRKSSFGTALNIGAKKIVNQFEELKISLSAISKLAELNTGRLLPVFTINDSPKTVAHKVRKELYPPKFKPTQKEFLRDLISTFADKNILVFEFVETWNKKEKANIDGFFLNPNVIVLKRQQTSFRREIFTLIHELGHYLINEEEVEEITISTLGRHNLSAIEKWCNDFAYYFLVGEHDAGMEKIQQANRSNDYCNDLIKNISDKTHLSKIALFTRLLFQNKITPTSYNVIKSNLEEKYRLREEEKKRQKELDKAYGKEGGSTPKPINSPLLISTMEAAFYEGVISEYDICKILKTSPDKLAFLQ